MLGKERLQQLTDLVGTYSKEELIWVNGYLSGLVAGEQPVVPAENIAGSNVLPKRISLVYGTETGNAKKLATQLAATAKKRGVNAKLVGLDQYRLADLAKEEYFFVVISTQGEGEPPAGAQKFYEHIHQEELTLTNMRFGVLALGDTSYPEYCKTGIEVNERLVKFGAKQVVPLVKCDVDYEADATAWFDGVLNLFNGQTADRQELKTVPVAAKKPVGKKYYNGKIIANINLNDRGSDKETYHIEIATEETISYEPGDTIGIIPRNRREVAARIIALTGIDPNLVVQATKVTAAVGELLTQHLNVCYLLTSTIKKYAAIIEQEIPDTRMDLVDLLRIYPVKDASQFEQVIKILMPIAPRLYSVASSPAAHGDREVHITVAKEFFLAQDEQKFGLCSEFLGDQPVNSELTFYVHRDKNFKLPSPDKDVIMIGPGTGIAPFRSFLAERDATGANGRNWLYFGERKFVTDFLYQSEIQNYLQTGVLTKIDLAFSHDQPERIFVQHRLRQQSAELFQWIDSGASVFVSGTKDPMSKEVEQTLLEIIEYNGKKSAEEAKQYLNQLEKEGRYEKDVY